MRDIRIYNYESGTLRKWSNFKKSYQSIEDAKEAIKKLKLKLLRFNDWQFVLVEYFNEPYNSKIIEVIEKI